jgi:hypothetical protein
MIRIVATVLLLVAVICKCLSQLAPPTGPGYSVTYSSPDAKWTSDGEAGHVEDEYGGTTSYGGGASTGGGIPGAIAVGPGSASASGPIIATFTWNDGGNPANIPPAVVLIREESTASWSGDNGGCANGLQHPPVPSSNGAISTGVRYSSRLNPGATFIVTCSPSANATLAANSSTGLLAGHASVSYSAAAYPVRLSLYGVVNPVTDKRSAVGCRVGGTAAIEGVFDLDLNYQWSQTSMCLPFNHYYFNNSNSQLIDWTPGNSSSTSMVFRDGGSVNLRCRIYDLDDGIDVTVEENLTIEEPILKNPPTEDSIGDFYLLPNLVVPNIFALSIRTANPNSPPPYNYGSGEIWQQRVIDPSSIIAMTPNASSQIVNVQLANLDYLINLRTTGQSLIPPGFTVGVWGLDGNAPYNQYALADGLANLEFYDTPRIETGQGNLNELSFMRIKGDFDVYLMYKPPTINSEYVSIAKQPWSCHGEASWISGSSTWRIDVNTRSNGSIAPWPFHPLWTFKVH